MRRAPARSRRAGAAGRPGPGAAWSSRPGCRRAPQASGPPPRVRPRRRARPARRTAARGVRARSQPRAEAYASTMARMVGLNHVALEVGDVDEAVEFYGRIFATELRGRVHGMAFLDMGDQFLALAQADEPAAGAGRHFGLVVDDRAAVRRACQEA